MAKLPDLLDARNARWRIISYGRRQGWPTEETDRLLDWIGLSPITPPKQLISDTYVYVISEDHPGSTLVKVGVSKTPEKRRHVLERDNDRNLYVAHLTAPYPRIKAMDIERTAHARLGRWAVGHEWFSCGTERAWEAVLACAPCQPCDEVL